MNETTDLKLISSLKRGDHEAFDALYGRYAEGLYAFVTSILKNPADAEEIVQNVFVKVWERRNTIEEKFSFKSYLFTIAYRDVITQLRKQNLLASIQINNNQELTVNDNNAELEIEFFNIDKIYHDILEKLPEKRKEIFLLSREKGLSNKEIAAQLSISVKTVENQMTATLRTFREKLSQYGILGVLFFFLFVR
ncbi:RNA polymerase sigma-70 factor [Prolixibacter denitrificans]|uniref:RNA polymerase sigma factor n=1 Tax=Prolixibacter denitrificans TaxID=1541063 RepID=A0A2P8C8E8_9BACT|nr:RNA polymerase sigma-70 factor [Prolixibacter denitrificans]PSK81237.1 RNA polymerase sigma-70 factor (ECF subfamily) [Prolixibacter denitrificans]GET21678.1 DNA-directed RNA polymerase sigma-70 factor [Prolixibacter denitrificans]